MIGIGFILFLISCSKSADSLPNNENQALLMVQTVSIEPSTTNKETRASELPTPVNSGTLWIGIRGTNGYTAQKGLIYTYNSGNGKWTCPTAVQLSKDPISLYAYWPQTNYPENNGMITLTTQNYAENKDLSYAISGGENVCSTHSAAGFILKHAYARIKVDISFSTYFPDNAILESVSVSGGGLYQDGTLILESGTINYGTSVQKVAWTSGQELAIINRKYVGDMLVVSAPTLTNATLNVRVDETNYSALLGNALTNIEAGKSYRVKAEVNKGSILITSLVAVENWIIDTPKNGDTEFE